MCLRQRIIAGRNLVIFLRTCLALSATLPTQACSFQSTVSDVSGLYSELQCHFSRQIVELSSNVTVHPASWPTPALIIGDLTLRSASGSSAAAFQVALQGVGNWIELSPHATLTLSNLIIHNSQPWTFTKYILYHSSDAMVILDHAILSFIDCTDGERVALNDALPVNHMSWNCRAEHVPPSLLNRVCLGNKCWQDVLVHHSTCMPGLNGSTIWLKNDTLVLCGAGTISEQESARNLHSHAWRIAVATSCAVGGLLLVVASVALYKWILARQAAASAVSSPTSDIPALVVSLSSNRRCLSPQRSRKTRQELLTMKQETGTGALAQFGQYIPDMSSCSELPTENIELRRFLGQGSYGCVYEAQWGAMIVAVKILEHAGNMLKVIEQEVNAASSLSHPNVMGAVCVLHQPCSRIIRTSIDMQNVSCHAVAASLSEPQEDMLNESGPIESWIVMELCLGGSMQDAIRRKDFMNGQVVNLELLFLRLRDVARGMAYLHQMNICHGDLKPDNILLTSKECSNTVAKVADFGLSRCMEACQTHIETQTKGTLSHTPPEMLADGVLTPSGDVYAFGIIMYECATGLHPFCALTFGELIQRVVDQQIRPIMPSYMPTCYSHLAERCWAANRNARPTFVEVAQELDTMLTSVGPMQEALTQTVLTLMSGFGF